MNFLFLISLSCQKTIKTDPIKVPTLIETQTDDSVKFEMNHLLEPDELTLPESLRKEWPPSQWTSAKAYTLNFSKDDRRGPRYVWSDQGWADTISDSTDLTATQANIALELIHRTGGGLIATKCPMVTRHAIVFFNADNQPVGSMNICFSCGDTATWPNYYIIPEDNHSRMSFMMAGDIDLPSDIILKWEHFFESLGMPKWEPNPSPLEPEPQQIND
jgi:hypothetical protein